MATNTIAVSSPRKTWISESTTKNTTIPPTTTAPTLSQFIPSPLSTGSSSIIIRFGGGPGRPRCGSTHVANGKAEVMHAFGIDIGGTGIKGAPVDVATGKMLTE